MTTPTRPQDYGTAELIDSAPHLLYRAYGDGCKGIAESCFDCPLPKCRHEIGLPETRNGRAIVQYLNEQRIAALHHQGFTKREIIQQTGLHRDTVGSALERIRNGHGN